ncbi:MAG: ribosome silencing factor [Coxiellaceae bacterium]|nr:ribosome silencing factor [Coxiellaceae bacterium]
MQTKELIPFIQAQLEDTKALDITVLDVSKLSNTIDAMIIATATSSRHAQSVAKKLVDAVKAAGVRPLGVEGETFGEWILIDCYDVLVHIMLKEQRELYDLEKLWSATEEHLKNKK